MSIPAGSTARVMVTGSYGAFSGMNAKPNITAGLNAIGFSVNNWTSNDPSLVSQILDGNFTSTDYQETLDVTIGSNYDSAAQIAADVGNVFQDVLGTPPIAATCTLVNGVSTGTNQDANSYGVNNVASTVTDAAKKALGGIQDEFNQILGTTETVVIVALIGVVLIVIFAPKTLKAFGL